VRIVSKEHYPHHCFCIGEIVQINSVAPHKDSRGTLWGCKSVSGLWQCVSEKDLEAVRRSEKEDK